MQQKREFESSNESSSIGAKENPSNQGNPNENPDDEDDEVQILEEKVISSTKLLSPVEISIDKATSPAELSPNRKKPISPTKTSPSKTSKTTSPSQSLPVSKSVTKNNAIRQMSGTSEGNQILNDAWDSPEKEQKGNTPLEMVEGIVANLQTISESISPVQPTTKKARKTQQPVIEPPAWVTTPRRPLLSSQIQRPNYTPPSTTESILNTGPINLLPSGQALMSSGSGMVSMNPHVMQLVNTINGPMLIPEGAQLQPINQVRLDKP